MAGLAICLRFTLAAVSLSKGGSHSTEQFENRCENDTAVLIVKPTAYSEYRNKRWRSHYNYLSFTSKARFFLLLTETHPRRSARPDPDRANIQVRLAQASLTNTQLLCMPPGRLVDRSSTAECSQAALLITDQMRDNADQRSCKGVLVEEFRRVVAAGPVSVSIHQSACPKAEVRGPKIDTVATLDVFFHRWAAYCLGCHTPYPEFPNTVALVEDEEYVVTWRGLRMFEHGSAVVFHCRRGYFARTRLAEATCLHGVWSWDMGNARCFKEAQQRTVSRTVAGVGGTIVIIAVLAVFAVAAFRRYKGYQIWEFGAARRKSSKKQRSPRSKATMQIRVVGRDEQRASGVVPAKRSGDRRAKVQSEERSKARKSSIKGRSAVRQGFPGPSPAANRGEKSHAQITPRRVSRSLPEQNQERPRQKKTEDRKTKGKTSLSAPGLNEKEQGRKRKTSRSPPGPNKTEQERKRKTSRSPPGPSKTEQERKRKTSRSPPGPSKTEQERKRKTSRSPPGPNKTEQERKRKTSRSPPGPNKAEQESKRKTSRSPPGPSKTEQERKRKTSRSPPGPNKTEQERKRKTSRSPPGPNKAEQESKRKTSRSPPGPNKTEQERKRKTSRSPPGPNKTEQERKRKTSLSPPGPNKTEQEGKRKTSLSPAGPNETERDKKRKTSLSAPGLNEKEQEGKRKTM